MSPLLLIKKNKNLLLYSISLGALLFLLKWIELRYIIFSHSFEIYAGLIAVIFTALGIWLALKLSAPKTRIVEVEKEIYIVKEAAFIPDTALIAQLEITKREMEILNLMAQGNSNEEIAAAIFVSVSTVKTHIQNLFFKLDVKRRTQAVDKAKRLKIIA